MSVCNQWLLAELADLETEWRAVWLWRAPASRRLLQCSAAAAGRCSCRRLLWVVQCRAAQVCTEGTTARHCPAHSDSERVSGSVGWGLWGGSPAEGLCVPGSARSGRSCCRWAYRSGMVHVCIGVSAIPQLHGEGSFGEVRVEAPCLWNTITGLAWL